MISFLENLYTNALSEIIIVTLFAILRLFRIDVFRRTMWLLRLLYFQTYHVFGWKFCILYTDADLDGIAGKNLASKLFEYTRDDKVKIIAIKEPEEIASFPIYKSVCSAVVILISDVSPLSTSKRRRHYIQTKLKHFCSSGGTLILGHDILYRRTHNNILQKLAGCELNSFHRAESGINYKKLISAEAAMFNRVSEDEELLKSLEDCFILHDGEFVTGDWAKDVKFLYVNPDMDNAPLVTRRRVNKGYVHWVNSGDKNVDGEPVTITLPDINFVKLLSKLVLHNAPLSAAIKPKK